MGLAQRFLRGTVLNLGDQALRFVAVFVMTPIMIRFLGDDRYGFWVLLMAIVGAMIMSRRMQEPNMELVDGEEDKKGS